MEIYCKPFVVFLFTLVICIYARGADVPACATVRSWFPGTPPLSFADNLPYELSVTGYIPDGQTIPVYNPSSVHTVYLNGSYIPHENKTRSFVAFIIYAENSVKDQENGAFVKEDFPAGVELVKCGSFYIVQNSTSMGNWTSLTLLWKPPKDHPSGNITFRAGVVESTGNPVKYYDGFTAKLGYDCPLLKCALDKPCSRFAHDDYGCQTCTCAEPCPDVICALACPNNNYKKDASGCKICSCADDNEDEGSTVSPTNASERTTEALGALVMGVISMKWVSLHVALF